MVSAFLIGIIRFSIVTESNLRAWSATRELSFQDSLDVVFSEERIKYRFSLFEKITLPCLDKLSESNRNNMKIIILSSVFLPEEWRNRLNLIVEKRSYISVYYANQQERIKLLARTLAKKEISKKTKIVVTFRIDDDDAITGLYADIIKRYAVEENIGKALSCDNGIYLEVGDDPGKFVVEKIKYPSIGCGLAYISSSRDFKTIYDLGPHTTIQRLYPMIIENHHNAWIRTIHDKADSGTGKTNLIRGARSMTPDEVQLYLDDDFGYLNFREIYNVISRN